MGQREIRACITKHVILRHYPNKKPIKSVKFYQFDGGFTLVLNPTLDFFQVSLVILLNDHRRP